MRKSAKFLQKAILPISDSKELYIAAERLSLIEWLELLKDPPRAAHFIEYMFPTNLMRDEYLQTINKREVSEVKELLRHFLPESVTYQVDVERLRTIIYDPKRSALALIEATSEYHRRLIYAVAGKRPVWEGLTWVLDLLPSSPKTAIDVVLAYFEAHLQVLPDNLFNSLDDAMAVIRAKFIESPNSPSLFFKLSDRQFQCLTSALYKKMGYETKVGSKGADGGVDILALKSIKGEKQLILIQCKRQNKNVSRPIVQQLHGTVANQKATKGVLITAGSFSRLAQNYSEQNPQVELVTGIELVRLLNNHLGANWYARVDHHIIEGLNRSGASEYPLDN